jgi:putative ABC transport system ATP-binding protein
VTEVLASCRGVVVTHGYGDAEVHALDGVDITIEERDSIALLGRSGSGKTTLLHVLGGLVKPSAGTVEWHGRSLGIAYVFQGANLLPYFTAFENVAFGARVCDNDPDHALAPLALLELVGLADKVDHLPSELSGGEAQRVAIARAIAQLPQLLLCDEPTGHLDSDTGARVLDLLEALQNEYGFALVVATHNVDVAARLHRAVELHDGRVLAAQVAV